MRSARKSMGNNIKAFRKHRKITQFELAKLLGYKSSGTLSQIENGIRGIDIDKMPKLAQILGIPVAVLVLDIDMAEKEVQLLIQLVDLIKNKNKSTELRNHFAALKKLLC